MFVYLISVVSGYVAFTILIRSGDVLRYDGGIVDTEFGGIIDPVHAFLSFK